MIISGGETSQSQCWCIYIEQQFYSWLEEGVQGG